MIVQKIAKLKASPVIYAMHNDSNANPKRLECESNDLLKRSLSLSDDKESAVQTM